MEQEDIIYEALHRYRETTTPEQKQKDWEKLESECLTGEAEENYMNKSKQPNCKFGDITIEMKIPRNLNLVLLTAEEIDLIRDLCETHKIKQEFDLRNIDNKETKEAKVAIHTIELSKSILEKL